MPGLERRGVRHHAPMDPTAYLPRWTKRTPMAEGGRDPLGLNRVADLLRGELLPGIITTTHRARYYSVFSWILWHIGEQREPPTTTDEFARALQRREAAFAVATYFDSMASVDPIGIEQIRRELSGDPERFSLDFQVLPGNRYGAFGQNYMNCMWELGLWHRPTEIREEILPGTGEQLALELADALSTTPYGQRALWTEDEVRREDLLASAEVMSLAALTRPGRERERDLLVDLLFGLDDQEEHEGRRHRRDTLGLLVWIARAYGLAGIRCPASQLEWPLLYAPLYYGRLVDDADDSPVELPSRFEEVATYWRHYCAHQYLTVALERCLQALLRLLGESARGLDRDDAAELLVTASFHEFLGERGVSSKGTTSPAAVMRAFGVHEVPRQHDSPAAHTHQDIASPRSQCALASERPDRSDTLFASGLMMLIGLYARWRALPRDLMTESLAIRIDQDPWIGTLLPMFDDWLDPTLDWIPAVARLLEYLIVRHDDVLYAKGKLESPWLRRAGSILSAEGDLLPQFRNARVEPAASMLFDLGIFTRAQAEDNEEAPLELSPLGHRTLDRVMEQEA